MAWYFVITIIMVGLSTLISASAYGLYLIMIGLERRTYARAVVIWAERIHPENQGGMTIPPAVAHSSGISRHGSADPSLPRPGNWA